ncbi:hypothetical protein DVA79_20545, partial [Acinetobacter baumannii]
RKIDAFVAEELLFHLGKLLLRRINLAEDQSDLLGDEGDVLLGVVEETVCLVVFRGVCEGVEREEVGGDDGKQHEEVDGRGTERCSSESG